MRIYEGGVYTGMHARMYMGKFYVVFYGAQYVFSPTETK